MENSWMCAFLRTRWRAARGEEAARATLRICEMQVCQSVQIQLPVGRRCVEFLRRTWVKEPGASPEAPHPAWALVAQVVIQTWRDLGGNRSHGNLFMHALRGRLGVGLRV